LLLPIQATAEDFAAVYKEEREKFVAAEKAIKQGKISEYQALRKELERYPLYPYLEYTELRYGFSNKKLPRVKKFIQKYRDVPISYLLRSAWLNHLAKNKDWDSYLDLYTPQNSIERQCNYLRALIHSKREQEAFKLIKPIWLHGGSRPDDCTPAFKAWHKAGKLTPELAWERIILTMQEGDTARARYLRRYLPQNQKGWFEQWIHIHNNPERLARKVKPKVPKKLQQTIIAHGLKRLARRNINTALTVWKRLQKDKEFPKQLLQQAEHAIAMRMMRSKHKGSLKFLDQIQPHASDNKLHERSLRYALSRQEWDLVYKWTQRLPQRLKNKDGWRYWNARALAKLGKTEDAKAKLRLLAKERSFYGFLAADLLEVKYNLNHRPSKVSAQTMRQVKNNQGLIRSREMFLLKRFTSSRREWRAATKGMKPEQLQGAAILARDWGLHDRSIIVLAQGGLWDDLNLRFPIAHRKQVDKIARQKNIESAWVFAVIRQESTFIQDAQSPAGALGLMQLMPKTARSTARKLKMKRLKESHILQPDVNIQLGATYLKTVLNELGQNKVLATAAYNAGPGRVRRWLPKKPVPADLWVATVPFDETRGYLERVLAYTVIYKDRLGERTGRLSDIMPPIQRNLRSPAKDSIKKRLQRLMSAR
jgi:soluble lytic murein transglycosylase